LILTIQLFFQLDFMPTKGEEDRQKALIACPYGNRVSQKPLKQFASDFVDAFQCGS
jgi:hypothetical protein